VGSGFPRVPGHEIAGVVDEVGPGVIMVAKGDRVGIGGFNKPCGKCRTCYHHHQGMNCATLQVTGIHIDGGYEEYAIAEANACAHIPDILSFSDAGPLMCAGVTTYNSIRRSAARAGDTVVIVGMGGLGHLGVQFASKMGFRTVVTSRGSEKRDISLKLGANLYIDTSKQSVKDELNKIGGAKVVIWTATTAAGMNDFVESLDLGGQIIIVAAFFEPIAINSISLLTSNGSIKGWSSGDAEDMSDTLQFAALTGVRPMVEKFPFSKAVEAYERMLSTKAQFRVVLEGWD